MKRWFKNSVSSLSLLLLVGLAVLGGCFFYPNWSFLHNFGEVVPGELYRSGQPNARALEKVVKEYKIKTIICLRGKEKRSVKEKARELGLNLVGVQMHADRPPGLERLAFLLKIISGQPFNRKDSGWLIEDWLGPEQKQVQLPGPYLVHCQMGADRTGYLIAVYRICFEGWSKTFARLEMLRYYHLPLRFPRLWQELEKMEPDKFCPELNPDYKSISASKS